MAVGDTVSPREMARTLAALVGTETIVERLWMSTTGDGVEFWLLTAPTDADTERRLYDLTAALYERFPDVPTELHILNPSLFADGAALGLLPSHAEEIMLREA